MYWHGIGFSREGNKDFFNDIEVPKYSKYSTGLQACHTIVYYILDL